MSPDDEHPRDGVPTMAIDHPPNAGRSTRPRPSAREPAGRPVQVEIFGPMAMVEPGVADLLAPALENRHRVYRPGGARGFEGVGDRKALCRREADGRLLIPAGLVPRAVALLKQAGYSVDVVDATPPRRRLRLDESKLAGRGPEARAFVETIAAHARGQIVARDRDRYDLLALVVRAFPEAMITVAVASRRAARSIREQLGRRVAEPVLAFSGCGQCWSDRRVRVATFGSLDEREADLVVFADAAELTHQRARDVYERLVNHKVFGFIAPGGLPGPWSRLQVEAMVGPVIYEVPDLMGRPAEVLVMVADSPWIPEVDAAAGLARKRAAIWQNGRRNEVVARVALALAAGDREALWEHGLRLGGEGADRDDDLAHDAAHRPRVAVLVESPEHGLELARRLPGWDLRSGRPGGAPAEVTAPLDRSIVTLVHAHHLDPLDIDVLVRADGGPGRLDLPGFPPRRRGPGRPVVLVDFGDDFDAGAAEASRGRLRAYEGLGWRVEAPARWSRRP